MSLNEVNGIQRYLFDSEDLVTLKRKIKSVNDEPEITLDSNIPIALLVHCGDKEKTIGVTPDKKILCNDLQQ